MGTFTCLDPGTGELGIGIGGRGTPGLPTGGACAIAISSRLTGEQAFLNREARPDSQDRHQL